MRYREVLTYPIAVRRDATQPLREQIAEQIAAAVDGGTAPRGARVPSTRTMAELLGVSRGVVGEAYDLLHARGYLVTRPGSGTFISGGTAPVKAVRSAAGAPVWTVDFTPGQLCGEAFPIRAWRAAWRYASHQIPAPTAAPAMGMPALRRAIAEHLAQTRGIVAPDHEVVVTTGTAAGLRLVLEAVGGPFAMERPMSPDLLRAAASVHPLPQAHSGPGFPPGDARSPHAPAVSGPDHACAPSQPGLSGPPSAAGQASSPAAGSVLLPSDAVPSMPADFADLPDRVRVAVICPDGNRPLGTVMPGSRRLEALDWARAGGTLVEVARDAVFQPHTAGLPRLQPAPGMVTVGGFGEVLAPSLKLGYALVPRELAGAVAGLIADRGEQPPDLTQLAVARLLVDGTMVRQMRRLTRLYAAKWSIVASILAQDPGTCPAIARPGGHPSGNCPAKARPGGHPSGNCPAKARPSGQPSGNCPASCGIMAGEAGTALIAHDDVTAPERLRRNGIKLPTLDTYGQPDQAFVLGFGHLPDKALRESLSHLVSSLGRSTQKEKW